MSKQNTNEISYEEFSRLDIRIGLIKFAEKIPGSHKLLRLIIDLGPSIGERQIISGIAESYKPEELVGKKVPVLTNLKPKNFWGM
ncbi:hypothetical protein [Fervidicoccus fontis]|uniref:Methionyl-tRNA synthetase n=1 Tax=Fervidicoccus fontis (strain DSM 19380 / JCM 18336 / VKM B-2539 / Kam940) TaxID=1163730 RepID=I0A039_FERFK|nr:hypothetical protein [Fervidicoccus fontis]AFH42346.1 methionyl-tRNA synthetase [Fervidicoccus fontis Kam940]